MATYGVAGIYDVTDTRGGYLSLPKLSRQLRFAAAPLMKFRQFCQVKEAFGKNNNDTVYFDKITKIDTAGGTLVEGTEIPEHAFGVGRGTIVINEYGNAVPYSGKLEALAEFDVDNTVTRVLRDDQADVIDTAVAAQFLLADTEYCCLSSTTGTYVTGHGFGGGTGTGQTAGAALNCYHVKEIVDELKKMNVPKYDGELKIAA